MGAVSKPTRTARLISAIAFFAVALVFALPAPANAELIANPVSSPVVVDGQNVPFDAYNIEGSTYFKLRDLAYILNGGAKSFEVSFDSRTKAILLTKGQPYTPAGGEMMLKSGGSVTPLPNASKVFLNGREIVLTAYNINGNTYFKLRDIAQALDFAVEWDEKSSTIIIATGRGYGQTAEDVPLARLPLATEELGGQQIGADLDETALGPPRRVLNEGGGNQVNIYGNYTHFTLLCLNNGKVIYIYVNYDNHNEHAEKSFTDSNDGNKVYAAAAGSIPIFDPHITEQLVFELTNAFRGYNGLDALRWNDTLSRAARNHSADMARRNFFSHQNPDGQSPDARLTKAGYHWLVCAENIIAGSQNGADAVDMLINSAPHRKNLLTVNCDEMGVGWVKAERGKYPYYGTQLFGKE